MKRIIYLLFAFSMLFSSCEGPEGPMGPTGQPGEGNNWKIVDLSIKYSDWVEKLDVNKMNRFYKAEFNMPEITKFIFTDGFVLGYVNFGTAQQSLPYTRHLEKIENGETIRWTETTDFDYEVGKLIIYFTSSDFAAVRPGNMNFRIVMLW